MVFDLSPLLPHLPAWAMVLFRLGGVFFFAPVLSSAAIPVRVKLFMVLGLSFCVYPALLDPGRASAALIAPVLQSGFPMWSLAGAIAMELLIGFTLGLAASLPIMGMQLAGQIADQQMGLGLGAIFNPDLGEDTAAMGQFYYLLAMTLFLVVPPGGHRVLLSTLIDTFQRVPLGGYRADQHTALLITGLITSAFELALRVAAPLLCLVFLETVAMGFLARTVPQMNVLSIGFALRIIIGVAVIVGSLRHETGAFIDAMNQNMSQLADGFAGR
ncbi:MAG: flagellar biosynthetic protein FliR [Planctomycetes bacterium]|nr:flagellar biosynthetic protein FliR [Planctomycetota bacterium]